MVRFVWGGGGSRILGIVSICGNHLELSPIYVYVSLRYITYLNKKYGYIKY
jgi:hypothetical protein